MAYNIKYQQKAYIIIMCIKAWNGICQNFGDRFMFFEYFNSIFL